jgi:hypothetical protein
MQTNRLQIRLIVGSCLAALVAACAERPRSAVNQGKIEIRTTASTQAGPVCFSGQVYVMSETSPPTKYSSASVSASSASNGGAQSILTCDASTTATVGFALTGPLTDCAGNTLNTVEDWHKPRTQSGVVCHPSSSGQESSVTLNMRFTVLSGGNGSIDVNVGLAVTTVQESAKVIDCKRFLPVPNDSILQGLSVGTSTPLVAFDAAMLVDQSVTPPAPITAAPAGSQHWNETGNGLLAYYSAQPEVANTSLLDFIAFVPAPNPGSYLRTALYAGILGVSSQATVNAVPACDGTQGTSIKEAYVGYTNTSSLAFAAIPVADGTGLQLVAVPSWVAGQPNYQAVQQTVSFGAPIANVFNCSNDFGYAAATASATFTLGVNTFDPAVGSANYLVSWDSGSSSWQSQSAGPSIQYCNSQTTGADSDFFVAGFGFDTLVKVVNTSNLSGAPGPVGGSTGRAQLMLSTPFGPPIRITSPDLAPGATYSARLSQLVPGGFAEGTLFALANGMSSIAATAEIVSGTVSFGTFNLAKIPLAPLPVPAPGAPQVFIAPFVINQSGYDTGIAITNKTRDPFGGTPQFGTCTLQFGAGGPTTNIQVGAGQMYTNVLSSLAPNYAGRLTASCNVPVGLFVFISDIGTRMFATSYMASVHAEGTSYVLPLITSDVGYDTGIRLANDSDLGASPVAGTCTLTFQGSSQVAPVTTPSIDPGQSLTLTLSSIAQGFVGSAAVSCGFPGKPVAMPILLSKSTLSYEEGVPVGAISGWGFPAVRDDSTATTTLTFTHYGSAGCDQGNNVQISYSSSVAGATSPAPDSLCVAPGTFASFSVNDAHPGFTGFVSVATKPGVIPYSMITSAISSAVLGGIDLGGGP